MAKLFRTVTTSKAESPELMAKDAYTTIFISDMHVDMKVGIYEHEKAASQPVLINLQAEVELPGDWRSDSYDDVVCYEAISKGIQRIADSGHINLLETFAEQIASFCLENKRIAGVTVRVEKTKVFDFARSAGIEIRRVRARA